MSEEWEEGHGRFSLGPGVTGPGLVFTGPTRQLTGSDRKEACLLARQKTDVSHQEHRRVPPGATYTLAAPERELPPTLPPLVPQRNEEGLVRRVWRRASWGPQLSVLIL